MGHSRAGLVGTLVAVVVVAAVSGLAGVLVPDNDQTDRVRLEPARSSVVAASAADSMVEPGSGRTRLFRVIGAPDGARMRFGALDLYDGEAWVPADESPGAGATGTFLRLGEQVQPLHPGPEVRVRVRVLPGYASDWLPTLGQITRLDLDYTDGRTQLADVRYNQASGSALVLGGVNPRDDYTFTAVLTTDDFDSSDATMPAANAQRQPEGAFLDPFLEPFDRSELTPLQRVLLVARYLRLNGEVRLTGTSSQLPADLGLRLIGSPRIAATPFQYSAVTALAASRLGVPARVVVGATPGRRGIVDDGDVVSWVELQFADGTWRTLEPDRYTGVHPYSDKEDEETLLAAGGWVEKELDLSEADIKIPKGADIELPPDAVFEEPSDAWHVIGLAVACLLCLVVVLCLAVPGAKAVRRVRRRRTSSWSGVYVNGWQEVLDAARDRGTPVPDSWSRARQATELGAGLALAREADAIVFAPQPNDVGRGEVFWSDCQELRRKLLSEAGGRQRAWARFNPASLVAGWARSRTPEPSVLHQPRDEDRRAGREQPSGA